MELVWRSFQGISFVATVPRNYLSRITENLSPGKFSKATSMLLKGTRDLNHE